MLCVCGFGLVVLVRCEVIGDEVEVVEKEGVLVVFCKNC